MFLLFVAYLLAFLFINYKWGMVATPVLQYGMYSGKHLLSDTMSVYRVVVNGRALEPAQLSSGQNDFVQTYLGLYPFYKENNLVVTETFRNSFSFLHPGNRASEKIVTDKIFVDWFKQKMQTIVAEPINSLQATRQNFVWTDRRLVAVDTASKLHFLDAH